MQCNNPCCLLKKRGFHFIVKRISRRLCTKFATIVKNKLIQEKYCLLRDDLVIYQRFDTLQLKCLSCKSANHFIAQCPLLNYIPNKELVLHKYKISEPQKRKDFTRKFHKINCRQNYHFNQIKAFEFKSLITKEVSRDRGQGYPLG